MTREQTVARMQEARVSAILRTNDATVAEAAMNAAVAGGFRVIEFTLTTPKAFPLIEKFSKNPDLLVGAGTVLTREELEASQQAGARFVVSPVTDPELIRRAREMDLATVPGTFTPTEMWQAHQAGADFLKLFPGPGNVPEYVTSVLGPFPQFRLFPTSGVTLENYVAVLNAGAAGVGFVRPLFQPSDLADRNYSAIEQRAARIFESLPSTA